MRDLYKLYGKFMVWIEYNPLWFCMVFKLLSLYVDFKCCLNLSIIGDIQAQVYWYSFAKNKGLKNVNIHTPQIGHTPKKFSFSD